MKKYIFAAIVMNLFTFDICKAADCTTKFEFGDRYYCFDDKRVYLNNGELYNGQLYAIFFPERYMWDDQEIKTCREHEIGSWSSELCVNNDTRCDLKGISILANDEYGNGLWLARSIKVGGIKVCPMRVRVTNKNKKDNVNLSWGIYGAEVDSCFWLCREGFSGSECEDYNKPKDDVTMYESGLLSEYYKKDYSNLASGEPEIIESEKEKCYGNVTEPHKTVLAVVGWTADGLGAKVSTMTIRGKRDGWDNMVTWPTIYRNSLNDILVCRIGYKPNSSKDGCEPINPARAPKTACSGWVADFDEAIYKQHETATCYEYRCKEEGKAFASTTDHSCIDCPATFRSGPSGTDGTCLKCAQAQVYNGSSCGEAIGYTKNDLMYGKGKTRSNADKNIDKQCWTILDTEKYKLCVEYGVDSSAEQNYIMGPVQTGTTTSAPQQSAS